MNSVEPFVWGLLDDSGEIVALHSDEQEGYVPLYRIESLLDRLEMIRLGHASSYDSCKDEIALSEVWALLADLRA